MSGSVVWDHYHGLVLQDGLGSKEDLSENGRGQQHSGWVEKETFDWNIMINMSGQQVLGASHVRIVESSSSTIVSSGVDGDEGKEGC